MVELGLKLNNTANPQLAHYRSHLAALSLHFVSFRSLNKGYTVRGSARHSPKFCSVSLRKTSYIPKR